MLKISHGWIYIPVLIIFYPITNFGRSYIYSGLISHLPDRVCVFAVFGSTPMDRFFLLHIVNTDTPIIEPYSHHIGVLRVNV